MKFESYTEQVMQYHEELSKIVALSVVPPNIHEITNQVEQINALLKWFSSIFYIFPLILIYIPRILSGKTSQTFWMRCCRTDTSSILLAFHVPLAVV